MTERVMARPHGRIVTSGEFKEPTAKGEILRLLAAVGILFTTAPTDAHITLASFRDFKSGETKRELTVVWGRPDGGRATDFFDIVYPVKGSPSNARLVIRHAYVPSDADIPASIRRHPSVMPSEQTHYALTAEFGALELKALAQAAR